MQKVLKGFVKALKVDCEFFISIGLKQLFDTELKAKVAKMNFLTLQTIYQSNHQQGNFR